jgi:hypothetical protein
MPSLQLSACGTLQTLMQTFRLSAFRVEAGMPDLRRRGGQIF